MIYLQGRCDGKVDSTNFKGPKLNNICPNMLRVTFFGPLQVDEIFKTTQANPECSSASPCSLGCMYLLALDYRRVFNLMISISQILILNDIRIPPSPYPTTNPISVELLVLLKFSHLHSFGQIKKPHLKTDGKTDCECVGFGLVESGVGTMVPCKGCSQVWKEALHTNCFNFLVHFLMDFDMNCLSM